MMAVIYPLILWMKNPLRTLQYLGRIKMKLLKELGGIVDFIATVIGFIFICAIVKFLIGG
jgi:hypothetical protein